jgi:hypothetical protein
MWEQSWGVLEPKWVGSNGEGYVLLRGPHWYGLPNLTVNAPNSLELAEAAIWFGHQVGDLNGTTVLGDLQCFGDKSNLLVQGSEQIVGGSEFTWDLPQEVFLSFKRFFLTAEFIGELVALLRPPKP